MCRGRMWEKDGKEYVRAALRPVHEPDERYDTDGFRCVEG